MRPHLEALTLLQRVWGAFGVLTGASLFVLAIGTDAALVERGSLGRAERVAVWILAVCAVTLVATGVGAFVAARGLRRRQRAGRVTALVLAVPNLLVVPFGTALGVYTFWVLLNNDARREFGRPPRGPSATAVPPPR